MQANVDMQSFLLRSPTLTQLRRSVRRMAVLWISNSL